MLSILIWSLGISLAINGILFLIAFRLQSDKLTDISYALTFTALALYYGLRAGIHIYNLIGISMIVVWALRLGGFLLYRVLRVGKDKRFDGVRESFKKFSMFWLGQAITVWILLIPAAAAFAKTHTLEPAVCIGLGIWAFGFLYETAADIQKYRFAHIEANKGKWVDTGVWKFSRHPNYFGEIAVWFGIYLYTVPVLGIGGQFIGFISPLFITVLLLYISGIPPLEKSADMRWGKSEQYQAYKARTSILIPLPHKK